MRKNIILLLLAGMSLSVGAEKVKKVKIVYNDDIGTLSIDRSKVKRISFTEEWPEEQIFTVDTVTFKMIKVEHGTFQMGSNDGYNDEQPVHKVTLTKDYYMGETEVTQALYKTVMGSNPSSNKGDQFPVEHVSYYNLISADGFLAKLNAKIAELYTDKTYTFRLPTEAEWEFAARGGNKSQGYTYSGSNTLSEVGWYGDDALTGCSHKVAQKAPNELGLYDMSGNLFEWCSDQAAGYSSEDQTDPTGPTDRLYYTIRGGSWHSYSKRCRSASRARQDPSDNLEDDLGLRLALIESGEKKISIEYNDGTATLSIDRSKVKKITFIDGDESTDLTFTIGGVPFKVIKVEAGVFQMGSTDEEASDDEQPVHKVTFIKDYYMGATEVTQALWKAVMGNNPSNFTTSDKLPVEKVSYNDIIGADGFLAQLNAKIAETYTDKTYKFRLPTEAEWEFAARGGNKSQGYKYSGGNYYRIVAWSEDVSSSTTHEVAGKNANELGLYDMSGNVWEWCSDWYGATYSSDAQTEPTGPTSGINRVCRGGSWRDPAKNCRPSYRYFYGPDARDSSLGFRLVLVIPE